jgi:hypothetical protein
LPQEWVFCNGQKVTDPASPMLGATLPNLTGGAGGNFLSGASVSGTFGGGGNITLPTSATSFWANSTSGANTPVQFTITGLSSTTPSSVPPAYYSVIYIIRIK